MKINSISFGRRLKKSEEAGYKKSVKEALKLLDKDLGIIVHHSSAPSEEKRDTGIGSFYSEASRNMVVPFLNLHNFSSVQLEPETTRKNGDASPYAASNNMSNVLMQDIYALTQDEYGNLLSKKTFDEVVNNKPAGEKVDFDYVNSAYDKVFNEVWTNLKKSENPTAKELKAQLENFKKEKQDELETSVLYEVLCEENKNDYWKNWHNENDKRLFELDEQTKNNRIAEIKEKYNDKINYLYFKQMLVSQAREKSIRELEQNGIKTIGDVPVAFSDSDVWSHPDIFLKDYHMGCPPEPYNPGGQAWGFAVYNPEKLFDQDGKLGKGGEFLFKKYQKLFKENKGGARIDHILGLIDPFVYKQTPASEGAGRLFSSRNDGVLGRFYKDDVKDFQAIIEKIVIPAAESVGLTKDNIICEDLGHMPHLARQAFNNLGLRGISITQYVNNKQVGDKNVVMTGSHDSPTLVEYTNNLYNQENPYNYNNNAWQVTEDIMPKDATHNDKQKYFDDMSREFNREGAKEKFMTSKFAQLFTSPAKSVQIFWTDVLGSDKRYNTPGTCGNKNWTLRMNKDFEDEYYKNLENNRGLNLPEVLKIALKQKGSAFTKQHANLINSLDSYEKILKEKE